MVLAHSMNGTMTKTQKLLFVILIAAVFAGIALRFHNITRNDFIFYDEGMYLNHNRELLDKIAQYPPKDLAEFFAIIKILFTTALATAKWL